MPTITPQHKIIKHYYRELQEFERANQTSRADFGINPSGWHFV